MSPPVCSCAEQVRKLTQHASVMRREIKNLRQQMDGAIRAHKKQMSSLQSMLTDCKHEDRLQSVLKGPTQSPCEINQLLEQGDTLHLSGVDIIAGTPVLDIKPYIPDYDSPKTRRDDTNCEYGQTSPFTDSQMPQVMDLDEEPNISGTSSEPSSELRVCPAGPSDFSQPERCASSDVTDVLAEVKNYVKQHQLFTESPEDKQTDSLESTSLSTNRFSSSSLKFGCEDYSTIAAWVRAPPVSNLDVRFTANAEKELKEFVPCDNTDSTRPKFQFLKGPEEAVAAIKGILSADPRSVYRRTRCQDRLFFFTLDTADITCWFGDGFAEVVRVKPMRS